MGIDGVTFAGYIDQSEFSKGLINVSSDVSTAEIDGPDGPLLLGRLERGAGPGAISG
jgi:hypothetical protein